MDNTWTDERVHQSFQNVGEKKLFVVGEKKLFVGQLLEFSQNKDNDSTIINYLLSGWLMDCLSALGGVWWRS